MIEDDYSDSQAEDTENEDMLNIEKLEKNITKLNAPLNKNKLKTLFESVLAQLAGDADEKRVGVLDENQMFTFIENLSNGIVNKFKVYVKTLNENNDVKEELVKEKKNFSKKVFNKEEEEKVLGNKRNRQTEEINEEELIDENEEELNQEDDIDQEIDDEADPDDDEDNKIKKKRGKKDDFFDMNEFNNIGDDAFEDIDLENPDEELDEEREQDEAEEDKELEKAPEKIKYEDFFKNPRNKKGGKGFDAKDEFSDGDVEDNIFDIENKLITNKKDDILKEYGSKKAHDLKVQINETEQKMIKDKEWHMKGEVTAKQRPKGSLLESFLDFDVSVKPPPIPTPEYIDDIEKIIRLRIKEDLYDDPVRKAGNLSSSNANFELNFSKEKKV